MSLYGDDCYFYYYSTCAKGTVCPYRHVPEARGIETTCTLWKAGQCVRPACRFRHMEITVDRSNIPCYWESQPTGCTKPHCPFKHFTEKSIFKPETTEPVEHERSVVAPVNKIVNKTLDRSTPSPTSLQQQNRSSPKIQPVVVNPFSDDSDEGSPLKRQQVKDINVNRAKVITFKKDTSDESSNKTDVKIKTLAEIRREKEMMKIINDSLEKPLEEDEPYKILERPVDNTRRIVIDNPTQHTLQPIVKKQIISVHKTVENNLDKPVIKGNIKSRLGKKFISNKDSTVESSPIVPDKPSISSRLGLTSKTKENKREEIGEIKVKSLDEIRAAKQQKKKVLNNSEDKKKEVTPKKGIRRITILDKEEQVNKPSIKTAEIRRKQALESLKAENNQEPEPKTTTNKIPEERKRKIRTVKQERAIYVPPGQQTESKASPGNISTSPKKARLSTDGEELLEPKTQDKIHVKTFAELMAEKRKRKEEEEAKAEKLNISPKKPRSNFTPIVFDLDQKDKMAAPKIVAATLPFRHKKSALVTPVQNNQTKSSIIDEKSISNSEITSNVSDSRISSADVVDSASDLDTVKKVSNVQKSEKLQNTEQKAILTKKTEIQYETEDASDTTVTIESKSARLQEVVPIVSESKSLEIVQEEKKPDTVISSITAQPVVETEQPKSKPNVISVKSLDSPVIKKDINIEKIPAPVKRKSSGIESSDKKKTRTSFLSDDDILLDDDDNDFTLSSEKFDHDDDDDILGDIDALLA